MRGGAWAKPGKAAIATGKTTMERAGSLIIIPVKPYCMAIVAFAAHETVNGWLTMTETAWLHRV
jgi:hypothetical protein